MKTEMQRRAETREAPVFVVVRQACGAHADKERIGGNVLPVPGTVIGTSSGIPPGRWIPFQGLCLPPIRRMVGKKPVRRPSRSAGVS